MNRTKYASVHKFNRPAQPVPKTQTTISEARAIAEELKVKKLIWFNPPLSEQEIDRILDRP